MIAERSIKNQRNDATEKRHWKWQKELQSKQSTSSIEGYKSNVQFKQGPNSSAKKESGMGEGLSLLKGTRVQEFWACVGYLILNMRFEVLPSSVAHVHQEYPRIPVSNHISRNPSPEARR